VITLIVLGIAVTVAVVVLAGVMPNTRRRENRFAASGERGTAPWIDVSGGGSDCDSGTSDAGCGDGGGGGGGD
jgi:hypothetical protein